MKKNSLFIAIIIILLALICAYFFISQKKQEKVYTKPDSFMWGVGAVPTGLGRYHISVWDKQLMLIEKLKVGWIRLKWDRYSSKNDEIIKATWEHGLDIVLVVEPKDFAKMTSENAEKDGFETVKTIANSYKGQIRYYQIFEEMSQMISKQDVVFAGNDTDYDTEKYNKLKNWVKGAEKALDQYDSSANIVFSSSDKTLNFLTKIKKDGFKFDIIGLQISSNDLYLLDNSEFINKLKKFDKPVILTAVSNIGQDELLQSEFISQAVNLTKNNLLIFKGFFIGNLLDSKDLVNGSSGLVKIMKTPSGTYIPSDTKKSYDVFRNLVQ